MVRVLPMVRRLTVEGYDAALARLQQEFELTEAIIAGAKVQLEDTHAGRWVEYQAMMAVRAPAPRTCSTFRMGRRFAGSLPGLPRRRWRACKRGAGASAWRCITE